MLILFTGKSNHDYVNNLTERKDFFKTDVLHSGNIIRA